MNLNVLHNICSVGPLSYGLGPVVLNLVSEQNRSGHEARIWCLDKGGDREWAAEISGVPISLIHTFSRSWPKMAGLSLDMEMSATRYDNCNNTVVHQHAIWTGLSRVTRILVKRHGTPSVVSPHGALEKWALNKSRWKKSIALSLYERENLAQASCLHACSIQEVEGFRDYGLSNPVAVIPNGIGNRWLRSKGDDSRFRRKYGIAKSKRIFLFLSRIAPIKGLLMLLEAIASGRHDLSDWILVIAGADETDHLRSVQRSIVAFGLEESVVFTGMINNQLKRDAYAAADVFVLPTHRESSALVVLEALGAAIPVITTKGAPWRDLDVHKCGWWTDISSDGLSSALIDAAARTPAELKAMGARGRKLVSSSYTWARSGEMSIELYEWLLGRAPKPDFVITE